MLESEQVLPSSRRIAFLLALALIAGASQAYIRNQRRAGVPFFQADPGNVAYLVSPDTAAGMRNRDGGLIITPDSSPTAAIAAAMERWSGIPGSALRFAPPLPAEDGTSRIDDLNLITFADSTFNRSVIQGAIAVTRLEGDSDGALTDTDILFNPGLTFSTTQAPGTFDIEGTLTHELGHAIGMDHAGPVTSTMFATAVRGSRRLRTLTEDDRAFVREVYPSADAEPMGVLTGTVRTMAGSPANGVLVSAVEPDQNIVVGAIAEADGSYRFGSLPPGDYTLTVDPLDGPARLGQLSFSRRGALEAFRTTVLGGARSATRIPVGAGLQASQDLVIPDGPAPFNIIGLGTPDEEGEVVTRAGIVVDRGRMYSLEMHGEGLDAPQLGEHSLLFLGAGVSVVPDTFARGTLEFANGDSFPMLRFDIFVARDAPYGTLSVGVATESDAALLTAGIEIQATAQTPLFSQDSIVNAASFVGGTVAPGEIVSIFGENLGPEAAELGRFDTVSGGLRTELAETAVFIQQLPAPLYYAGPGQINAQVPVGLTPGLPAFVRIVREGVSSAPVLIPVAAQAPGVFTLDGTAAAALNQDGALNTAATPADRGSVVTLFATGQGLTDPAVETGQPAPFDPLSEAAGVDVLVDGQPAEVLFAGLAPGFVGLLQVNVRIPSTATEGVVDLKVRGVSAATVTIELR